MQMNPIFKAHSAAWLESRPYRLAWLAWPMVVAMLVFGSRFWITQSNNFRFLSVPLSYTPEENAEIDAGLKTNEAATLRALRAAADDGDLRALNYMGILHDPTDKPQVSSLQRSADTALAYFDKAAALGSVHALVNAGVMMNALNETTKACGYFKKAFAAEPERLPAKSEAGYCLATDKQATATDKARGVDMMEAAGAAGFARAYALLGALYSQQTPKDNKLAVGYFEKAVAGNVDDQGYSHQRLGDIYLGGAPGVPSDHKKALFHSQKAHELGSASSAAALSVIYSTGNFGVPVDLAKAFKYASAAAQRGSPAGHSNLAGFYLEGKGTPRNERMAVKHYLSAVSLGQRSTLEYLKAGTFSAEFVRELQLRLSKAALYFGPVDGKGSAALIKGLESLLNSRVEFE